MDQCHGEAATGLLLRDCGIIPVTRSNHKSLLLQFVVLTLVDLFCALGFPECYHTLLFKVFRLLLSLLLLMTSGQVLLTRCEPSPALPSSLDEGQIWKVKVNSGSSFYRACSVWLDPVGPEGKKTRRVPYFMAARIASCACRFATPEQHVAVGMPAK